MKRFITREGGFTLIELLIVILIIGILIAVAAPSFLGQTEKAHDSAAKQDLALAYKAAKASSIDRSVQGNWTDAPDDYDTSLGGPGNDGRPDTFADVGVAESNGQAPAGEFDEDELIAAILANEPLLEDGLVVGAVLQDTANLDGEAVLLLGDPNADGTYIAVTCTPADCASNQVLHIYTKSNSGKIWKISVPANGPLGNFTAIYTP